MPDGMLAYMVRTTVKIPDELDARLRHEAARQGMTISEFTRRALEIALAPPETPGFVGIGSSGRSDVSEAIEAILRREISPR